MVRQDYQTFRDLLKEAFCLQVVLRRVEDLNPSGVIQLDNVNYTNSIPSFFLVGFGVCTTVIFFNPFVGAPVHLVYTCTPGVHTCDVLSVTLYNTRICAAFGRLILERWPSSPCSPPSAPPSPAWTSSHWSLPSFGPRF